jgi:hypothetical protein
MNVKEQLVAQDVDVDRRVYDDRVEFVADFGPGATPSVDVVDGTVIVVDGGDQHELAVEGDVQAVNRNGVVTIEVDE